MRDLGRLGSALATPFLPKLLYKLICFGFADLRQIVNELFAVLPLDDCRRGALTQVTPQ